MTAEAHYEYLDTTKRKSTQLRMKYFSMFCMLEIMFRILILKTYLFFRRILTTIHQMFLGT